MKPLLLTMVTALCLLVLADQAYRVGHRAGFLDWSMQCSRAALL